MRTHLECFDGLQYLDPHLPTSDLSFSWRHDISGPERFDGLDNSFLNQVIGLTKVEGVSKHHSG